MKKLLLVSVLLLAFCSIAGAEAIPQGYDYNKESFQWKQIIYNNTNKIICSNTVVTLDMSVSSGAYQGFAAYASQKTATAYIATLGVADKDIASKSLGIITTKGPHLVSVVNQAGDKGSIGNIFPEVGNAVVVTGDQKEHQAGSGYSSLGYVVKASAHAIGTTNYFGKILGYRIGQTSTAGTADNYASSAVGNLIWIWIEPSMSLNSSTVVY